MILVPGLGLFGIGASAKDAAQVANLAEANAEVIIAAEALGRFESVSEAELFDIEYCSLEQAKFGHTAEGAWRVTWWWSPASAPGSATPWPKRSRPRAPRWPVLDVDGAPAEASASRLGRLGIAYNVTDGHAVKHAFGRVSTHFGGCDLLVSNAATAWQGEIRRVGDLVFKKVSSSTSSPTSGSPRTRSGECARKGAAGVSCSTYRNRR